MVRNETTLQPDIYAERLPDDLANRQCFVLDPMLATGGSLIAAIDYLFARGAVDVTAVCLIGAPEGLEAVKKATEGREVTIVLGALDEKLNEVGYIVPGLGDAGDRLYGTVRELHFVRACKKLACMTDHSRTLTSLEAPGNAGMMMPVRAVACCRMCA